MVHGLEAVDVAKLSRYLAMASSNAGGGVTSVTFPQLVHRRW